MKTFWEDAMITAKLPLARRHYSSPHARCLETCETAFSGLTLPPGAGEVPPFKPLIKELIRERLGIHTCDRRRTQTWIRENHPIFAIEEGFAENDELWKPDVRETVGEHAVRIRGFLDDLFANDSEHIVSVTCHSGSVVALYEVIGHPEVRVAPGAIIPVLIKAEVVDANGV
jgi:broad specificity phosphatase PhoE